MAPVAVETMSILTADLSKPIAVLPTKGLALAIGSLSTAQDGKYQKLVTDLEGSRQVEKQLLDRLLDGGERVGSYPANRCSCSADPTRSCHTVLRCLFFRTRLPRSI